ncbi:MAG: CinA family protein [Chlamydiia bacterium]|nr:CinA family protein [Chlamydiia bacterium]
MAEQACKAEDALHHLLIRNKSTLAFAESCTGGALSARMTALPDASTYFCGSVVSYSNAVKQNLLNVSEATLAQHGAVSRETAEEMLSGVFKHFDSDYAMAVTGIAGPSGGTPEKPVGTVWIAIGKKGQTPHIGLVPKVKPQHSRATIIQITATFALSSLWRFIRHGIAPFEVGL